MDILTEIELAKIAVAEGIPHDLGPVTEAIAAAAMVVAAATTAETLEWDADFPMMVATLGLCDAVAALHSGDHAAAEYVLAWSQVAVQRWGAVFPDSVA